jgi:hypothetical protein
MPLPSITGVVLGLLGLLGLYLIVKSFLDRRGNRPLPPGPKSKPIIGNLMDLPPSGKPDWLHWLRHKALYGMEK